MRIVWDPRALQDLADIRVFIAADKPEAASRVANHIKASVARLSEFPLMGRQAQASNLRILPIAGTPYIVYYHVVWDAVEILAIFHGARRRFAK